MPLYAVLIYAEDSAHAADATKDDLREPDGHAADPVVAEAMLAAYAFLPRDRAVSVRAGGVTPGPFVDGPAVVAGVYVLEAPDLDAAVRIAGTNPAVRGVGGVEVRPVHSGGAVRAPRG